MCTPVCHTHARMYIHVYFTVRVHEHCYCCVATRQEGWLACTECLFVQSRVRVLECLCSINWYQFQSNQFQRENDRTHAISSQATTNFGNNALHFAYNADNHKMIKFDSHIVNEINTYVSHSHSRLLLAKDGDHKLANAKNKDHKMPQECARTILWANQSCKLQKDVSFFHSCYASSHLHNRLLFNISLIAWNCCHSDSYL